MDLSGAKSTGRSANYPYAAGLMQVAIHRRRFVTSTCKPGDFALLQRLLQFDPAGRARSVAGESREVSKPRSAFHAAAGGKPSLTSRA